MPLPTEVRSFLDSHNTQYFLTEHPTAFTARETAAAEHLPAAEVAKTVVIFGDGEYHMLVVPANRVVDFQEARAALGLSHVRLATESELAQLFPGCELGAMPPFGNLYGFAVYLDSGLAGEDIIAFNAGTHREAIHMSTAIYRKLVKPSIVSLAREVAMRHGW